jgi:hypothetical protein
MTIAEARRQYREFMERTDVASAFGHGSSMPGSHPALQSLRDEADRLLAQLRTLEAIGGERPLNDPWRVVTVEYCDN